MPDAPVEVGGKREGVEHVALINVLAAVVIVGAEQGYAPADAPPPAFVGSILHKGEPLRNGGVRGVAERPRL